MGIIGGDVVAAVLKHHGVRHIFTLCGGHISPILVACKKNGIAVIDVRHEADAVFAADAVARLTGVPGVAAVTAGPGVTNTITALKNAQMAQSPVVVLGGAAATVIKGRGSLQDIDQIALVRSICKAALKIRRNNHIVPMLERAFQKAQSDVPGPVFVECPIDLLYSEALVRHWYGAKSDGGGTGVADRVIRFYLQRHLNHMFKADLDVAGITRRKISMPGLKSSKVEKASQIIARARKPVLVVGSQAMLVPGQTHLLIDAVRRLNVPVYLTGMARGLLGPSHGLQMRHNRSDALKDADVVILAGMPCDFRLGYGRTINPAARLVAINRSRKDLTLNRRPSIAIHADPCETLMALAGTVPEETAGRQIWIDRLRRADQTREAKIAAMAETATRHVNPIHFLRQLDRFLDDRTILVADGGDFIGTAAYTLRPRGPLSWLDPGVFGTLGVGAGFAMGAQLSRPDAQVWLLYGDGAAGYSLQEFDTFVRHQLPVIAVVGNDAAWAQIARDQVTYLEDDVATVLRPTDYHIVAQGFGGKGFLVARAEQIQPTLQAARDAAGQGFPVLINVLIGKTDFREGSISV